MQQADENGVSKAVNNEDLKPVKDVDIAQLQDNVEPIKKMKFGSSKVVDSIIPKDVESQLTKEIEPVIRNDVESKVIESRIPVRAEDQRLFKDVEEMKSKLHELELKLSKVGYFTRFCISSCDIMVSPSLLPFCFSLIPPPPVLS